MGKEVVTVKMLIEAAWGIRRESEQGEVAMSCSHISM